MAEKHICGGADFKDDTKPFYVLEYPSGIYFIFEKMKEVKEHLNSDFHQDLILSQYGAPELLYFRTGSFEPSRLDYDKWIKKD